MSKLSLYYHTIRDLKWKQIKYQLLRKISSPPFRKRIFKGQTRLLKFLPAPPNTSYKPGLKFTFLNLEHIFKYDILWDYHGHGKLWNYNLNYFNYLNQDSLTKEEGLKLITSWMQSPCVEPYPTSLRLINWIRFLSKFNINDSDIIDSVYSQSSYLSKNIEFHLMGNHLMENGFSLIIAGLYLNNQDFIQQGHLILEHEIDEQILEDGAHFELSPMYHSIILHRLIELLGVIDLNQIQNLTSLKEKATYKASKMLAWTNELIFRNGDLPRLNDTVEGIAPEHSFLKKVAKEIGLREMTIRLGDSGYRKLYHGKAELLVDVGAIGPSYIPGHAHSDTLSFILHLDKKPIIVDVGISTYEKNDRRQWERSTSAHNTVKIGDEEQSEIWGGFRVARKAKIIKLEEFENTLRAEHDGYSKLGCNHLRQFQLEKDEIVIRDELSNGLQAIAYLHFHPDTSLRREASMIYVNNSYIKFENASDVKLEDYAYAIGFNKTKSARKAVITFRNKLVTRIHF